MGAWATVDEVHNEEQEDQPKYPKQDVQLPGCAGSRFRVMASPTRPSVVKQTLAVAFRDLPVRRPTPKLDSSPARFIGVNSV